MRLLVCIQIRYPSRYTLILMANQGVGLNHNHEYVILPSVLDIDERVQYPKQVTVLGTTANMYAHLAII